MADGKDEKVRAAEATADVTTAEACPYKPGVRNEETLTMPANSTDMTEADAQTSALSTPAQATALDSQSEPALPQRNYARDPRALTYSYGQPQPIPPNTFLPRFLKGLAWFILLGSSLATLSTALYQRYVLPKLLLKARQMLSFNRSALTLQEKSTAGIRQLATSNVTVYPEAARQYGLTQSALEGSADTTAKQLATTLGTDFEKMSESAVSDKTAVHDAAHVTELGASTSNDITHNLRSSVERLAESLASRLALTKDQNRSDAAKAALQSLEKLSSRITNEAIHATTPSYSSAAYGYSYSGAANRLPARSGADIDKLQAVKSEIRSLKGTLLTRRNFATPQRIEVESAAS